MQRDEKRPKLCTETEPAPSAPQTAPKQVWVLNLEAIQAQLPNRPQDVLPELDNIFHFLSTTPENTRPFVPDLYRVNDTVDLKLECNVIVRRDQYNRIKIDLFSADKPVASTIKTAVFPITTVNCVDLTNKKFHVKSTSKYLAKQIKVTLKKNTAVLNKYAETYDSKDDPTSVCEYITTEVNNMRSIGFNKVKGPYFKAVTGEVAHMHGFFTMRKIHGTELFDRIKDGHFNSYEKIFEITLRCLHAADKQVFQHGKLHLDIKAENFISIDYCTQPVRTRVKLIDCETLHDANAHTASRHIGTHGYSTPELMKNKIIEPTADVYSLGMLSRILSQDISAQYFLCTKLTHQLLQKMDHEIGAHGHIRPCYKAVGNIDPQVMQGLVNWHVNSTQANPASRLSTKDCIAEFEKLYIEFRLSQFPGDAFAAKRKAMQSGLEIGFEFARACREHGINKLGLRNDELLAFINQLIAIIQKLYLNKSDVTEFVLVIDDAILFGCNNYLEIANHVTNIYRSLMFALTSWNKLGSDIHPCSDYETFKKEYETFFNTIKNTPLTLDDLADMTQHIIEKEKKMRARYQLPKYSKKDVKSAMDREMHIEPNLDAALAADNGATTEQESPVKRAKI